MQHAAVAITLQANGSATLSHHTLLGPAAHTPACTLGGVATRPARQLAAQQAPAAEAVAAAVLVQGTQLAVAGFAAGQGLAAISRQLEGIVAGAALLGSCSDCWQNPPLFPLAESYGRTYMNRQTAS